MELNQLSIFKDKKMNCLSVLAETNIKSYLEYVDSIFEKNGGIDGQRAPLKSKSAIKIRNRMIEDISQGAVLPPIVIGMLVNDEIFDNIETGKVKINEAIRSTDKSNISIIDGMQRTTSIKAALEINSEIETQLRVDIWVAKDINNLIYRMLILNTAQIPWSIKRQLEVVFNPFKLRIEQDVDGITLYTEDDSARRTHAGEFQASSIIELFLNFSIKKIHIDLKESLAEEFARLDIIESTSHQDFLSDFIVAINYMCQLDRAFFKFSDITLNDGLELNKFKKGLDLFSSHPARIGFITAISHFIYGKPGFNFTTEQISANRDLLSRHMKSEITKINSFDELTICQYMNLSTLDERISRKSGKVGEFEREYFHKAFTEYLSNFKSNIEIHSMESAWLAYS